MTLCSCSAPFPTGGACVPVSLGTSRISCRSGSGGPSAGVSSMQEHGLLVQVRFLTRIWSRLQCSQYHQMHLQNTWNAKNS